MRQTTVPDSKTKVKLVGVTEELLAEMGFDAVSVRDITKKAGANVAAVNYHFGGRDGLLDLIAERHVTAVNEERRARLDAIAGVSGVPVLESLVDAWLRPIVDYSRKEGVSEKIMLRLIGRLFGEESGNLPSSVFVSYQDTIVRFKRLIQTVFPELGALEVAWRIHFLNGAMSHLLTQEGAFLRLVDESGGVGVDEGVSALVRFAVAGLRGGLTAGSAPVEKQRKSKVAVEVSTGRIPVLKSVVKEPVQPGPVQPESVQPEPVLPESVLPEPVLPELVLPELVLPEPVLPEPVLPEPVLPEPVLPEPVLPEPVDELEAAAVFVDGRTLVEEPKEEERVDLESAVVEDVPKSVAKKRGKKASSVPQTEFLF